MPADVFLNALRSLGYELFDGPAKHSFFPEKEGKRTNPIFLPLPFRGWYGAETVDRICDELGVDLLDVYMEARKLAEERFGPQKRGDLQPSAKAAEA